MPIILGGGNCYRKRTHGDISVAFHWLNNEPCMVLFPTFRRGPGVTPFAVPLSCAWEYAEDEILVEKAYKACEIMGLGDDKGVVMKVARIMNDSLPDLIEMPPMPVKPKESTGSGEMTIKVDGDKVAEFEV